MELARLGALDSLAHPSFLRSLIMLLRHLAVFLSVCICCVGAAFAGDPITLTPITLTKDAHVVLICNGLGSRMLEYPSFETEVQRRHVGLQLIIRNMCDDGDTPGYRDRSGLNNPFAFPGAEKFYNLSDTKDRHGSGNVGEGFLETPDEWLTRLSADVVIAFFGFNESFNGTAGLDSFRAEMSEFIIHTQQQKYNGKSAPQLALVSPIAFQDLSALYATPNGKEENSNLSLYTTAMKEVAAKHGVLFIDIFTPTKAWFAASKEPLTRDGALLTEAGYARLTPVLVDALFGVKPVQGDLEKVTAAVQDKNWFWQNWYKIPNGVHVFGRRHKPFGPDNYPDELKKLEEMTLIRDQAILAALKGESFDVAAADAKTHPLPEIKTNFTPSNQKNGTPDYKIGQEALSALHVSEGYHIEQFATEQEFPNLANPVQMSFDNKGRLWVATMPSYPHYQPGDARPNDKLLIYEDTNGDGRADKETVFADQLHLPIGFEFAPEGVYVSQGSHLYLLRDTNGDDKADIKELVMGGFDDHDTHHAISAFCADPSGAFYLAEGTFLHSHIETAYGPIRSTNGGFFRYSPQTRQLERTARQSIPNPWGVAFDQWGQDFYLETSSPDAHWMLPGTVKVPFGEFAPLSPNLIEKAQMVRPTSGLEFVSSRHFPDAVQGDMLLCNNIGFLGIKQHQMMDDGTGFKTKFRQDLLISKEDGNFRPVDLEFAPDGSLYVIDWHNVLIGHMQHSARDPLRDHTHGRIYRITYPSRPLVQPAKIVDATIPQLLDNLKLPEYRTRYRTRRELRGRPVADVVAAIKTWVAALDRSDAQYEHNLLEALWVTWGINQVDGDLLKQVLAAKDYRARAAAVRVLRYSGQHIPDQVALLQRAAADTDGRVRLEVVAAASWLAKEPGLSVLDVVAKTTVDSYIAPSLEVARATLNGTRVVAIKEKDIATTLKGEEKRLFKLGSEVYRREGHCVTCHQLDGNGLPAAQFPPLAGSEWVSGNEERLIRLTLHGLMGPITVKGVSYPGLVPMTPFKGLSDEELAGVLTYVRNDFGNKASAILPDQVKAVREKTKDQPGFLNPADLLKQFPDKK
jgi:mono/diheme cytochrome c family protein/glucose/arabinose dehydrogenase/lysophospholipase L1-like esterase